ncbi:MAG TPA: hypothetical protein VIH76_05480 [Candidatus Acidoferrales bacterium]
MAGAQERGSVDGGAGNLKNEKGKGKKEKGRMGMKISHVKLFVLTLGEKRRQDAGATTAIGEIEQ